MPRRWLCLITLTLVAVLVASDAVADSIPGRRNIGSVMQQQAVYCPAPVELDLLELINAHREVNGRQPLILSIALGAAARHHAESMASFDYFDYALVPEGIDFAQNVANFGYPGTYLGANIAAGPSSDRAATVFSQWLASPSQRENLLNPGFAAIGLGSASNPNATFEHYWAAAFGELANDPAYPECDPAAASTEAANNPTVSVDATSSTEPSETAGADSTEASTRTVQAPASPAATFEVVPTSTAAIDATSTPTSASIPADATPAETLLPTMPTDASPDIGQFASPIASPGLLASPVGGVGCTADRVDARAADRIVLTCTGFEPGEGVEVYWDQPREENLFTSGVADDGGNGELSFLAPETPAGPYLVIVRGELTSATETLTIEIRPGLFVLPLSGDPGDVVTADLTGFQPGEAVTINWYVNDKETRVLRVVTVGEDGSLTTTFRAPASSAGPHDVSAVGISGGRADTTFVIEET